ncbi:hypothetical protein ACJ67_08080 [Methylophilus sp. TWE2]|nr:hypothetical protein ACJ67_08080 [Methylophilus sp. TWE2]
MYGSDKVILYLARGLLQTNRFHPIVVLPDDGPLKRALEESNVEVHVAKVAKISRKVFSLSGLVRLFGELVISLKEINKIVNNRNVDIIHSNTLAVLSGAVWAFLKRKKHLWHVHEIILTPRIVSKTFPLIIRLFSHKVVSNSTLTEKWLLTEEPALANRSVVIFNGLPDVIRPSDESIKKFRHTVGATEDDLVITLAGRLNKWKGQELLLEAASLIKQNNRISRLKFVIVGSAAPGLEFLPEQLKALANSLGIEKHVTFIEFVDDIWPIWFGTDIAVVPSTEPEPFGMVAIEAMAASLPVIAAAHGGLLDIVIHEETGLLFEPKNAQKLADTITTLTADKKLRKRMGHMGAQRQFELFSIASQLNKTLITYEAMK